MLTHQSFENLKRSFPLLCKLIDWLLSSFKPSHIRSTRFLLTYQDWIIAAAILLLKKFWVLIALDTGTLFKIVSRRKKS